eukprot:Em0021g438a
MGLRSALRQGISADRVTWFGFIVQQYPEVNPLSSIVIGKGLYIIHKTDDLHVARPDEELPVEEENGDIDGDIPAEASETDDEINSNIDREIPAETSESDDEIETEEPPVDQGDHLQDAEDVTHDEDVQMPPANLRQWEENHLALLDQGMYFMGMVKTATKEYPKKQLLQWASGNGTGPTPNRGSSAAQTTEPWLPMYKENIMNGKYPQRICKYCKIKTTFYCVGCSDLENDYWFHTVALALPEIAIL